jgi:hypothetical protein
MTLRADDKRPRHPIKIEYSETRGKLQIAAGTTEPRPTVSLEPEIRLVKPAILYGDEMVLYSLGSGFSTHLRSTTPADLLAAVDAKFDAQYPDIAPDMKWLAKWADQLRKTTNRSAKDEKFLADWDEYLADRQAGEATFRHQMLVQSGFAELEVAEAAGLLRIEPIADWKVLPLSDSSDEVVRSWVTLLPELVSGKLSYPLFDLLTGKIIARGISEGLYTADAGAIKRGVQVSTASRLFAQLPSFDRASVNEIVDIRRELETPLMRFRRGVSELGQLVESPAYDAGFDAEIDDLITTRVQPGLLEIEERIQNNSYLRQLLTAPAGTPAQYIGGGVLAIGAAMVSSLAGLLLAVGILSQPFFEAVRAQWLESESIERHSMYFLYATREMLRPDA